MPTKDISGWQQALRAVPDLAPPEGNTTSTNERISTKKRKSTSVEAVEDVKRPKLNSQGSQRVPENKKDAKRERVKTTPSPTRSTTIVKHHINEDDKKAIDDKEKLGDSPKGTRDTAPILSRRTRSTSRQLEPDSTQTLESNTTDKEKVISTPGKETTSVECRVPPKNKKTSDDDKGERLVPAIRTTKTKRRLSLDEKEDVNKVHESDLVSDKRPVIAESTSTVDYKRALDLEKPEKKPKETKKLSEKRPEAKKPREKKAPAQRATPARAPERYHNYSGADSSSYAYGNMIRQMTNNLRREWGE